MKDLKVLSSSIHPGVGHESIHNVDSINTALLGIDQGALPLEHHVPTLAQDHGTVVVAPAARSTAHPLKFSYVDTTVGREAPLCSKRKPHYCLQLALLLLAPELSSDLGSVAATA